MKQECSKCHKLLDIILFTLKKESRKENQNLKEFILYSFAYIPMPTIWLIILYFLVKSNYWKNFLVYLGFIFLLIPSLPIVPTYLEKFFHNDSYRISNHHKTPSYVLVPGAGATADSYFPTIKSFFRCFNCRIYIFFRS